ncbi:hypothetical protein K501DRAFT_313293 [Backusella circina FSU 941]|nr:hypothetical protein K501DRAFT_313293 [Backusella circina FSU 941]
MNPFESNSSNPPTGDTAWESNTKEEKVEVSQLSRQKSESNKQEVPLEQAHTSSASIDVPDEKHSPQEEKHHKPSKPRFFIRVWQFIAAIGAFGFQIGATPYSQESIPFEDHKLLYFAYGISWISILWSAFNIFVYLSRRFGKGNKIKRFVSTALDLALAALFAVCAFYQIATYSCKPGTYNGWCNFFNTGLFFLMSLFVTYAIHTIWDIFGAMSCLRR